MARDKRCGFEHKVDAVFEDFSTKLPLAIESVQAALPAGFPAIISDSIFEGALQKAKLLG